MDEVNVIPKPHQQPHPPLRVAATTSDTFPQVGAAGYRVFVGLRGMDRPDLMRNLESYREAWRAAGHPGNGDVFLRIPVFVAKNASQAVAEAEESTMRSYRRMAQNFSNSASVAGAVASEERVARGQRLASVTYEELLRDRLAYGSPEGVASLLNEITQELGLSGIVAETNVGGLIPMEKVLESIELFSKEVAPALR